MKSFEYEDYAVYQNSWPLQTLSDGHAHTHKEMMNQLGHSVVTFYVLEGLFNQVVTSRFHTKANQKGL